jgi:hypothetical protein
MHINFEFMVGVAVGKVLLGALFASPIFRGVALAAAAGIICFTYFQRGVAGILETAHVLIGDFAARPGFSQGLALGALLGIIVFGAFLSRRPS